MKQFIRLFIISFLAVSCAPKASESAGITMKTDSVSVTVDETQENDNSSKSTENVKQTEIVKKKIIKDGRLGIKVKELQKAKTSIDTLVRKFGGYYDKENLTNNDYATEYDLKIRIPADKFEAFISKIEVGENIVSYKEIDTRDVTDQFIDLQTRLTNKQKYMTRYQELLKSAKSIKEVLDIQEKIRAIEEEIESTTGRLKYMSDLVNYSTLDLNISQKKDFKYTPEQRANLSEKIKQSLIGGWYAFVDFLLFLLNIWAFLIIISVAIYFWIKYRRRRKSKKIKSESNQTPNA